MVPLLVSADEWSRLEAGIEPADAAAQSRSCWISTARNGCCGADCCLRRWRWPTRRFCARATACVCRATSTCTCMASIWRAAPDGQWAVLADRTQAPSGAGYALENRLVLLHSLPEAFRGCHIQRLASFFRSQRDCAERTVADRATARQGRPADAGPVQRDLLRARLPGAVSRLHARRRRRPDRARSPRVHQDARRACSRSTSIFRRLDDSFCDPLELRGDSFLGVAGLVDAVRAGNVAVANALGSGVIETAALLPFLPALCRELLGEELLLPSVPTWWCGRRSHLAYVLEHLRRPGASSRRFRPRVRSRSSGASSATAKRKGWRRRSGPGPTTSSRRRMWSCRARRCGTASTWSRGRSSSAPTSPRPDDTFTVMPGGLTRVSSTQEVPIVSMQRGGRSKDTWVLSHGPVSAVTLLHARPIRSRFEPSTTELAQPRRRESLLARPLRRTRRAHRPAAAQLRLAPGRIRTRPTIRGRCRRCCTCWSSLRVLPEELGQDTWLRKLEEDTLDLIARQGPHTGLRNALNEVRRLASVVRDRLSIDTWRILNLLQQDMRLRQGRIQFEEVLVHLNRIITDLAAFSGMEMENMTRGHGWRFLNLGRRLERSVNLVGVLRGALDGGAHGRRRDRRAAAGDRRQLDDLPSPLLRAAAARPGAAPAARRRDEYARPRVPAGGRSPSTSSACRAIRRAPSPTKEERLIANALAHAGSGAATGYSQPLVRRSRSRRSTRCSDSIEDDLKALSERSHLLSTSATPSCG